MTLKDFELQNKRFHCLFLQFSAAPRTSRVNCDKMAGDGLRQFVNRNCYRLARVSWALAQISCYLCCRLFGCGIWVDVGWWRCLCHTPWRCRRYIVWASYGPCLLSARSTWRHRLDRHSTQARRRRVLRPRLGRLRRRLRRPVRRLLAGWVAYTTLGFGILRILHIFAILPSPSNVLSSNHALTVHNTVHYFHTYFALYFLSFGDFLIPPFYAYCRIIIRLILFGQL